MYGTDEFTRMEQLGAAELQYCCFAIVGGGIGERLGSSLPKLCLPCNLVTEESFLSFYFSYFRAIQHRFHCTVPVVIMTSQATHDPYVHLHVFILVFVTNWKHIIITG